MTTIKNYCSLLTIGLLSLIVVSFSSCEGPEGMPGLDGNVSTLVEYVTVQPNEWVEVTSSIDGSSFNYLQAVVNVPTIDQNVIDFGYSSTWLLNGNSDLQLPDVRGVKSPMDGTKIWQSTSAEITLGQVVFRIENAHGNYTTPETKPNDVIEFKIMSDIGPIYQ